MNERIYFDNAATTAVRQEVIDAMLPYYSKEFGNPSSIHNYGTMAAQAVSESRQTLANVINARPEDIYFTSGGSESDNWAIELAACNKKGKHIIISRIEHHAILRKCEAMKEKGYDISVIDVDEWGVVKLNELIKAIRKDTILISVMTANNEIGTIEPIERIGRIARANDILFHTDAVQAFAQIHINVREMNIDMLSACAHKLHGPKGVGLLYAGERVKMKPMIYGGMQENGARAGTENVPGIVGFAKAAKLSIDGYNERIRRILYLRNYLISRIMSEVPFVRLNGHPTNRLPSNANFSFQFVEGESLVILLDLKGISVSSGSACSQGDTNPSYVLSAIGVPQDMAYSSVRLTISEDTTKNDIDTAVEAIKEVVAELRSKSSMYNSLMRRR